VCSLFTVFKVKEYSPDEYAVYHGIQNQAQKEKMGMFQLLLNAPKEFWTITVVQFFCWMGFQYLWTYGAGAVAKNAWNAVDPSSTAYQEAANWFGVLSGVYSLAAVFWSLVLTKVPKNKQKPAYAFSLVLGGVGFGSVFFIHNPGTLLVSFILIGIAWAAMMAFPFTILTNALSGENMGTYLGLFNGSICLPQIVASCLSFLIFPALGSSMPAMILLSGVLLVIGAASVSLIKTTQTK